MFEDQKKHEKDLGQTAFHFIKSHLKDHIDEARRRMQCPGSPLKNLYTDSKAKEKLKDYFLDIIEMDSKNVKTFSNEIDQAFIKDFTSRGKPGYSLTADSLKILSYCCSGHESEDNKVFASIKNDNWGNTINERVINNPKYLLEMIKDIASQLIVDEISKIDQELIANKTLIQQKEPLYPNRDPSAKDLSL